MSNPYSAPNAPMSGAMPNDESYEPQIFAVNGRIGRLRYLAYSMLYGLLSYVVFGVLIAIFGMGIFLGQGAEGLSIAAIVLFAVAYIGVIISSVFLMRRRLNDLDKTGWLLLIMIIPIVNLILMIYMVFWPGTATSNRWGPKPIKNSTGVVVAASIVPVLMIVGIIAAVSLPAYMGYKDRAESTQMNSESAYEDESYGEESYNEEGYSEEATDEESYQEQDSEEAYQDDSYQEEGAEEETYSEETSSEDTQEGDGQ